MKKNNTAEKAILEAQEISKALKEGTNKRLASIINESIEDYINGEKDEDNTDKDDKDIEKDENNNTAENDDYTEDDVETDDDLKDNSEEGTEEKGEKEPDENKTTDDDSDSDDEDGDEWQELLDKHSVGNGDYDFTKEDGEIALNVFSNLGKDDKIFVHRNGDNNFSMKDGNTGAEYTIKVETEDNTEGNNDDAATNNDITADPDNIDITDTLELGLDGENSDLEGMENIDGENSDEEDTFTFDLDDDNAEDETEGDNSIEDDFEGEDDDLNKELNETNLGYTTTYQKDVFDTKLGMKEPANKNATYSMDAGVPKGEERPYGQKIGDGKPYDDKIEEGTNVGGAVQQRSTSKSHIPANRKDNGPKVKHNVSAEGEFTPEVNESVMKLIKAAKSIQAENKKYKEAIGAIKKSLAEAAVLNVNYGHVVRLLVNETASREEKLKIVDRFDKVKTINEGKQLYETIKSELNEAKKKSSVIAEQISATPSKQTINETPIYNPKDNPSVNLMERMDNLYKKNKK